MMAAPAANADHMNPSSGRLFLIAVLLSPETKGKVLVADLTVA
jgi:hypothetical protein